MQKQKFCICYKRDKNELLSNLKNILDNWKFWKTAKRMLSNKLVSIETIISIENKNIIADDKDIRKSWMVFSQTLNIPRINQSD